jgi:hypothetical protein
MQDSDPNRSSTAGRYKAGPTIGILVLGLLVLAVGCAFLFWVQRYEPDALRPVPSPQAPP